MLLLLLAAALQVPIERAMLEEENARSENPSVLLEALQSSDEKIRRLAVRAIGRLEREALGDSVRSLLASPDPGVRMEAVNALGQINAPIDFRALLKDENDGGVRGVIFETIGRMRSLLPDVEETLVQGLSDPILDARTGAAKGLEALFRIQAGTIKPSGLTIAALNQAFRENTSPRLRELVMLALTQAAATVEASTLRAALDDPEPQVRRLAVLASKQWKDDASPIVRYEALRVAGDCNRYIAGLRDASEHVALLAIDLLANGCPAAVLEQIVDRDKSWRRQGRALVSLAKLNPASAQKRLAKAAESDIWQARAYAASAAKILKDTRMLQRLMDDKNPNVVAAAITSPRDALRALNGTDYGLIHTAAERLKGWEQGRLAMPVLLSTLIRVSGEKKATSRDIRVELLERLREFGDIRVLGDLRPLTTDFDPVVAKLAADIISEKSGSPTPARPTVEKIKPIPSHDYIRRLKNASATIKMKEAGPFTLALLTGDAPVTVGTFAELAEKGYYNGLTMHRIAPNFVVQGGSPGANEYTAASDYIRDELGLLSHLRGTLGISTRGRDTGDAQIFINLVDNFRLDHNYTVFARITEGMENVDKIQEGDVIESIEIRRSVQPQ